MLKSIIVDDEPKSRESLQILLEDFVDDVTVTALCRDVTEAIEAIRNDKPDLVFLDIRLRHETGFDLLTRLGEIDFEIIFVTAYSEYAIKAIKFSAIDYLLKPVDIGELKNAVAKVKKKRNGKTSRRLEVLQNNLQATTPEKMKIALPTMEGLAFFYIDEILYCKASSNYTIVYVATGREYVASKTLKEYEEMLAMHNFFRIHHSYLVNLNAIKKYVKGNGGYVVLNNDITLEVSRRKKADFINRFIPKS